MTESLTQALERHEQRRAEVIARRPPVIAVSVGKALHATASTIAMEPRTEAEEAGVCACRGTGWMVTPGRDAGTARPCVCRSNRPIADLLADAGVWERYRSCTRETWRETWRPWPEKALADFPDSRSTLTVFGLVGAGKTHLATAVFATWLRSGKRGFWRDVSTVLTDIKRGFADGAADAITAQLCSPRHLLLLDDLGAEQATDWNESRLSYVLRYRHGRRLPTILTTNVSSLLKLDEIEPRLSSRCGEGALVKLSGLDRRTARGDA